MIRNALYSAYCTIARPTISKIEKLSHKPYDAQMMKLNQILGDNLKSRFGKEHGFSSIKSYEDFASSCPIGDYQDFSGYLEAQLNGEKAVLTAENPYMYASTSGTTGTPKFIPITKKFMEEYRSGAIVSGYNLYRCFPGISKGTTLTLVSPAQEGVTKYGVPYGAMTGAIYKNEPWVVKKYIAPIPYEVMTSGDYESRYYNTLRLALELNTSLIYTPNPSTIELLCRKLQEHAPRFLKDIYEGTTNSPGEFPRESKEAITPFLAPNKTRARQLEKLLIADKFTPEFIWPDLSVLTCWTKAAASFYLSSFPQYFGGVPVCDLTYCASEGRGSVMIAPDKNMLAIGSHFFEFIEETEMGKSNPDVKLAHQLESGKNYFILFTTSSGLYRYNINDVVRVTGFHNNTPLIEFQYKGGNVSSFTGEKITELQVTAAMKRVVRNYSPVRYFTLLPDTEPDVHYSLLVESKCEQPDFEETLARQFDQELQVENIEYASKRASGRLGPVSVFLLKEGTYEKLRRVLSNAGTPDVQIKLSHLNPKDEVKEFLTSNLQKAELTVY